MQNGVILYESLRQKCVYEVTKQEKPSLWFDYTVAFIDNCANKTLFGDDCAIAQMKKVGVNHEKVSKCVSESFVTGANGKIVDNKILAEDAKLAKT